MEPFLVLNRTISSKSVLLSTCCSGWLHSGPRQKSLSWSFILVFLPK